MFRAIIAEWWFFSERNRKWRANRQGNGIGGNHKLAFISSAAAGEWDVLFLLLGFCDEAVDALSLRLGPAVQRAGTVPCSVAIVYLPYSVSY